MNNTHNQKNYENKKNVINNIFNKIKEDIKANSMYANLENDKIIEFINLSYDEITNDKQSFEFQSENDEIYTQHCTSK